MIPIQGDLDPLEAPQTLRPLVFWANAQITIIQTLDADIDSLSGQAPTQIELDIEIADIGGPIAQYPPDRRSKIIDCEGGGRGERRPFLEITVQEIRLLARRNFIYGVYQATDMG